MKTFILMSTESYSPDGKNRFYCCLINKCASTALRVIKREVLSYKFSSPPKVWLIREFGCDSSRSLDINLNIDDGRCHSRVQNNGAGELKITLRDNSKLTFGNGATENIVDTHYILGEYQPFSSTDLPLNSTPTRYEAMLNDVTSSYEKAKHNKGLPPWVAATFLASHKEFPWMCTINNSLKEIHAARIPTYRSREQAEAYDKRYRDRKRHTRPTVQEHSQKRVKKVVLKSHEAWIEENLIATRRRKRKEREAKEAARARQREQQEQRREAWHQQIVALRLAEDPTVVDPMVVSEYNSLISEPPEGYIVCEHKCWKCWNRTPVYTWEGHSFMQTVTPPGDRPKSIMFVFSKSVSKHYWANTCMHCDSIQGDTYIYEPNGPLPEEHSGRSKPIPKLKTVVLPELGGYS